MGVPTTAAHIAMLYRYILMLTVKLVPLSHSWARIGVTDRAELEVRRAYRGPMQCLAQIAGKAATLRMSKLYRNGCLSQQGRP